MFLISVEKRGLFELGEYAGVDAQFFEESGDIFNRQKEETRLSDFVNFFSDNIFPGECVQRMSCEIASNYPTMANTFDW